MFLKAFSDGCGALCNDEKAVQTRISLSLAGRDDMVFMNTHVEVTNQKGSTLLKILLIAEAEVSPVVLQEVYFHILKFWENNV